MSFDRNHYFLSTYRLTWNDFTCFWAGFTIERGNIVAASINQLIKRYYTTRLDKEPELSVFDLFEWKRVDVHMEDYKTGRVLVDMKDLEFPVAYSQNACDIIASKYFRKAGVGGERDRNTACGRLPTDGGLLVVALIDEGSSMKGKKSNSVR